MRQLSIIPIVHTSADLGMLTTQFDQVKQLRFSKESVDESRRLILQFWESLRHAIESWDIDYSKLSIYQDALPTIGKHPMERNAQPSIHEGLELRIVRDLAGKGSHNHQLLLWLVERGALLVGTESPELLVMEYEIVRKSIMNAMEDSKDSGFEIETEMASLLHRRDEFIAKRIDSTLTHDSNALLFIGMLHDVARWLPTDIQINYPFGKPNLPKMREANPTPSITHP